MGLDLKHEPIGVLLRKMAVPAIIAMVVNGLYYLVDAAFVGWGVGSGALAGLAIVFPVQMFVIAWGSMLGMGVAAIIAQTLGRDDESGARSAAANAVLLALASGILISFGSAAGGRAFLYRIGATEGTIDAAFAYLSALQFGFPFVFLSMVGFNVARAQGNAEHAKRGMILGTIVNLALDPIAIFVLDMGVAGAAWATVVARVLSSVFFFVLFRPARVRVALRIAIGTIDPAVAIRIIVLGFGSFVGQISFSIVAVLVNRALRSIGSDIDLAVYGILSRVHVFSTMPFLGLAQGFQPIAGFGYGSGAWDRFRAVLRRTLIIGYVVGVLLGALVILFPREIFALFSNEVGLTNAGVAPLRISLAAFPLIWMQLLGVAYFQAIDRALQTLIVSLSRQIIFLVPLLIVIPRSMGLMGVWISFPLADTLAAALTGIMIARSMKRVMETDGAGRQRSA